jgi:hypothetical protein
MNNNHSTHSPTVPMNDSMQATAQGPTSAGGTVAEPTATLVVDGRGAVLQAHLGARAVVCTRGELWTLADAIDNVHLDDRLALWTAFDRKADGPTATELVESVRVLHDGWWCTTTVGIRAEVQDGERVRVVEVGPLVPQQRADREFA